MVNGAAAFGEEPLMRRCLHKHHVLSAKGSQLSLILGAGEMLNIQARPSANDNAALPRVLERSNCQAAHELGAGAYHGAPSYVHWRVAFSYELFALLQRIIRAPHIVALLGNLHLPGRRHPNVASNYDVLLRPVLRIREQSRAIGHDKWRVQVRDSPLCVKKLLSTHVLTTHDVLTYFLRRELFHRRNLLFNGASPRRHRLKRPQMYQRLLRL
mmetsp:Transcript_68583/g.146770  ORF Transcript_68583/g.146770 Transcript_68583/m.146770 type:complete len:213 (+) Transcript_68583:922-1560(+)